MLRKSRRAPEVGDIFLLNPPGTYLYGRVIRTDANPLGVGGGILVYVYGIRSSAPRPIPDLLRSDLLVPPMMTNRIPWSRGFFEFLENRSLTRFDVLEQHCFRGYLGRDLHADEFGTELRRPVEPVGEFGLHSYRTIDDEISTALGIPLAPD